MNPKTTPLIMYPITGGSLIVLAVKPPKNAAVIMRIISLKKVCGIIFQFMVLPR
jgi:hypothetical protein